MATLQVTERPRTLSDILRMYGDMDIQSMEYDSPFDCVPEIRLTLFPKIEVKSEKTVKDVLDSFTEEQRTVLYYLVGEAVRETRKGDKNDVFDIGGLLKVGNSTIGEWTMDTDMLDDYPYSNMSERQQLLQDYTVSKGCCEAPKEETKNDIFKEDHKMEMFNGMFGKVANGMCRLSMNGGIAVKTSNGYKTYNMKSKRLVNCNNFVFNIGEEFFFVIPTNKVEPGDIILVNGKPKCVIEADKETITVINYEDSTIDKMLPERHVFMGNTYFYGKIVSMFGNDILEGKGDKGMKKIMTYMMMSEMMKGGTGKGDMSSMLPFMMMSGNGGFGDIFSGLFDFDDADDCSDIEDGAEK